MSTTGCEAAVEVRDLVKRFGHVRALDGLDLTVGAGQVHGFLGPNGAGKSTTIRVLLGLLRADSGHARVLGLDPWAQATALHRRLAYVPGDVSLWPQLTGGEAIDLLGRTRGGLDPARRDHLIELFDLDPARRCRTYSKGNRQKVALVAALACEVDLLLLDEPTSGLDPLMERAFTREVRARRDEGVTVLLSSHVLSEVEALCDHVSIIRGGRVVDSGTLAGMRHLTRTRVSAVVARPDAHVLDGVEGVHGVVVEGDRVACEVDEAALSPVLARLAPLGVHALTSSPPTLEELFLQHYGRGAEGTS